jgi:hypothetical protein
VSRRVLLVALVGAAWLPLLGGCYEDDGGARARAREMQALAPQSYRQAGGACDDAAECAQKAAGFAFAKRARLSDPDDCPAKGDADFIDGCQQYGDDVEAAIKTARQRF